MAQISWFFAVRFLGLITPLCPSVTYMFWALPFLQPSCFWMWLARNISWSYFDITSLGCSVFSILHFLALALFYSQADFGSV